MHNPLKALFGSALMLVLLACGGTNGPAIRESGNPGTIAVNFNTAWADTSFWDDGKAEVAVYNATRTIYKKQRRFEYTVITVSETFNKKYRVKTEDYQRSDLYNVMKLNAFARIQTDKYPYHFLSSLFFLRSNTISADKFTISSQEWCGNTFKSFLNQDNHFLFSYNSYWDGEGRGERKLENDFLFEDQLGYSLRSLKFREGLQFRARVLSAQISNKVTDNGFYDARFTVTNAGTTWKVTVQLAEGKQNEYVFAAAYPNLLLQQRTWDARNLKLKNVSRYAYWPQ